MTSDLNVGPPLIIMQTLDFDSLARGFLPGSAVTIGNFDGVHLGHREIIGRTLARGRLLGLPVCVLTFDPHPREVVKRGHTVPAIMPFAERARLIADLGVDYLVKVRFTLSFADQLAETFVENLAGRLNPRVVVIGHDFRFGRGREGSAELLTGLGVRLGFAVEAVPVVEAGGKPVSSTRIRGLIQAGEMEHARALLGSPFSIEGEIIHGHGRGRGLGFATANLRPDARLLPADGVYAAVAHFDDQSRPAVVNIGDNPTFSDTTRTIEAHILDFHDDLYARALRLDFYRRLRGEIKFGSPDELKAQIGRDVAEARRILAESAAAEGR